MVSRSDRSERVLDVEKRGACDIWGQLEFKEAPMIAGNQRVSELSPEGATVAVGTCDAMR